MVYFSFISDTAYISILTPLPESSEWKSQTVSTTWVITTFTALIILLWTPKICLECLLCFNLSQMRSSNHGNHRQRTISYLSRNKLFSFCFNIQHVNNIAFPSYLFTVCAIKAKNTYRFKRFLEINYKADVPGGPTWRFGVWIFKLFVTIDNRNH